MSYLEPLVYLVFLVMKLPNLKEKTLKSRKYTDNNIARSKFEILTIKAIKVNKLFQENLAVCYMACRARIDQ